MSKNNFLIWIYAVLWLFADSALAEEMLSQDVPAASSSPRLFTLELNYKLYSPEILYPVDGGNVIVVPKEAGQPGIRFSKENFGISFNQSLLSKNSGSGGFDLSYSWGNSYVQAYHVWASGYQIQVNANSKDKKDYIYKDDMTGVSDGLLFLRGFDESSVFSMMTDRGPRDQKSISTPLQYTYQILVDKSTFEDSVAFGDGSNVRKKERTSLLPGLGAMTSESTPVGYVFTACSVGLGMIEERMTHTTRLSEEKRDAALALACLVNMIFQEPEINPKPAGVRLYGGMSGGLQFIQPFDKKLMAQRMFLVSVFIGAQF